MGSYPCLRSIPVEILQHLSSRAVGKVPLRNRRNAVDKHPIHALRRQFRILPSVRLMNPFGVKQAQVRICAHFNPTLFRQAKQVCRLTGDFSDGIR